MGHPSPGLFLLLLTFSSTVEALHRRAGVSEGDGTADVVYNWALEDAVLSPDGYPRQVFVVVDLDSPDQDVVPSTTTGVYKKANVPPPGNPINDRVIDRNGNSKIPGPLLRVRTGQTVAIRITNNMFTPVSIHWHGIHMPHQGWQDGVRGVSECGINQGETKTYKFVVEQEPGTHWYHSHVQAQTADGIQGPIIIDPAEGKADIVKATTPYTIDETLMVMDWFHQPSQSIGVKSQARIGTYDQDVSAAWHMQQAQKYFNEANTMKDDPDRAALEDYMNSTLVGEPFLPDYPWPSPYVLLNGRGQNKSPRGQPCTPITYADCEVVNAVGWAYWVNASNPPGGRWVGQSGFGSGLWNLKHTLPSRGPGGLPTNTFGQCQPEAESLMGRCVPEASPAELQCEPGQATRIRIINSGMAAPLRVWVDRHKMTVVAMDGIPVEPNGPHKLICIGIGQRYDVVIKCDQNPTKSYKIFAQVAVYEYYLGAQVSNFQAYSYAVLRYNNPQGVEYPTITEEWDPDYDFPSVLAGQSAARHYMTYRSKYADWRFSNKEWIPTAIQLALKPLDASLKTAPAATARFQVASDVMGNFWNNVSYAAEHYGGLNLEWWSIDQGPEWFGNVSPLYLPHQPILQGRMMGLSVEEAFRYDSKLYQDERFNNTAARVPTILHMTFDPVNPLTYEIVHINWEGQQHPFHLHGMKAMLVGQFWLDPIHKWSHKAHLNEDRVFHYDAAFRSQYGLPDLDQEVRGVHIADTFIMPPKSVWVLRVTADNPGVWLAHCHMDMHLEDGQGYIISIEEPGGGLGLPPPPDDFVLCGNTEVNTYGAYAARMTCHGGWSDSATTGAAAGAVVGALVMATLMFLLGRHAGLTSVALSNPPAGPTPKLCQTPVQTADLSTKSPATDTATDNTDLQYGVKVLSV